MAKTEKVEEPSLFSSSDRVGYFKILGVEVLAQPGDPEDLVRFMCMIDLLPDHLPHWRNLTSDQRSALSIAMEGAVGIAERHKQEVPTAALVVASMACDFTEQVLDQYSVASVNEKILQDDNLPLDARVAALHGAVMVAQDPATSGTDKARINHTAVNFLIDHRDELFGDPRVSQIRILFDVLAVGREKGLIPPPV